MTRLRVLVVVAVAAVLSTSAPAGAHAQLIGGCPGGGDRLAELEEIELVFGEPLLDDGTAAIDLLADNGQTAVELGPVVFSEDRMTLSAAVLESLEPGFHIVRVTATSFDGDPNGADTGFQFEFDPDADPISETCDLPEGGGSGGWVLLLVGVVAVGALVFFLRPRPSGD